MSDDRVALAWAKVRAAGPLATPAGSAPIPGLARLIEPGGERVWLVPQIGESADARILTELGLAAIPVDQPADTSRVLAVCLRCCWTNPLDAPWPGTAVPFGAVSALFGQITGGRDEQAQHRSAKAAVRRLHAAGWLLWDEGRSMVRLGPRVALWSTADLSVLRQLWRSLPTPTDSSPAGPGTTHQHLAEPEAGAP